MLTALALSLGFPAGILLMLVTMAALDPTSDRNAEAPPGAHGALRSESQTRARCSAQARVVSLSSPDTTQLRWRHQVTATYLVSR